MARYPRTIAVLTGDLYNSGDLGTARIERAMSALQTCAERNSHWIGVNFTRQSGDGWQILIENPEGALRSALAFRAALKAAGTEFETYASISTGILGTPPHKDLNQMNTPVFVQSGRQLSILKQRSKKDGVLITHWAKGFSASVACLADHISQSWTPPQAQAMLLYLDPFSDEPSYTKAAETLGISRQSVTKTLKAAGKDAVLQALFLLEAALRANPEGVADA